MKSFIISVLFISFAFCAQAQKINTSPFKHLPIPQKTSMLKNIFANDVIAYRFVLPFAGYSLLTQQISTGVGYGWNKLHFVDSTKTYYTDLSVFCALFINGNLPEAKTSLYNFTSVGVGVGFLNDLIMLIPSYNLPTVEHKGGAFDLKVSFGLLLK